MSATDPALFYHRVDILRRAPLVMIPTGNGQRIVYPTIIEKLTRVARGELVLLTPGSTEPVVEAWQHAGVVPAKRVASDIL